MRFYKIILILLIYSYSIAQDRANEDSILAAKGLEIAKVISNQNISLLKNYFYSIEYFNSLDINEQLIQSFSNEINRHKLGGVNEVTIKEGEGTINGINSNNLKIKFAYLPLGVDLKSSITPKYFLGMQFVYKQMEYKLVGFNLLPVEQSLIHNNLPIYETIDFNKLEIINSYFYYQGGYKNTEKFIKSELKDLSISDTKKYNRLIQLLTESEIIKAFKVNDTRRFELNPELSVLRFELSDNMKFNVFNVISTKKKQEFNPENHIELRYFYSLNVAVTYFIKTKDDILTRRLINEICKSGKEYIQERKPIRFE